MAPNKMKRYLPLRPIPIHVQSIYRYRSSPSTITNPNHVIHNRTRYQTTFPQLGRITIERIRIPPVRLTPSTTDQILPGGKWKKQTVINNNHQIDSSSRISTKMIQPIPNEGSFVTSNSNPNPITLPTNQSAFNYNGSQLLSSFHQPAPVALGVQYPFTPSGLATTVPQPNPNMYSGMQLTTPNIPNGILPNVLYVPVPFFIPRVEGAPGMMQNSPMIIVSSPENENSAKEENDNDEYQNVNRD